MLGRSLNLLVVGLVGLVTALTNPIIPGFNPDPSILRVNDTYYIATSTFEYFPAVPIYKSQNLVDWELVSHAFERPETLMLYGVPTGAGVWAPTLRYLHGRFYVIGMTRWVYDPISRLFPRMFYASSADLVTWSDLTWTEPWGIDPDLFVDPVTNKTYLTHQGINNNVDRIWGIYQLTIDLDTGASTSDVQLIYNGTLPNNSSSRPEGPHLYYKDEYYYLLTAEGGTDDGHRATIARSHTPSGPWEPAPKNPILFNGGYGYRYLTVQSTGHADMVETPDGRWFMTFLARRNVNGSSPLGRETFMTPMEWVDGWPLVQAPISLTVDAPGLPDNGAVPDTFHDEFNATCLRNDYYQLRTPYTANYELTQGVGGLPPLRMLPNIFTLSNRDTPSALLRKQKSLNMTFSAGLAVPRGGFETARQEVGLSVYLSEFQHQDVAVKNCKQGGGLCVWTQIIRNGTVSETWTPVGEEDEGELSLWIRAEPLRYQFGWSVGECEIEWVAEVESKWLAFAPTNYFVFTGAMWAIYASSNGFPWPVGAEEVGFNWVKEEYWGEELPEVDKW
ncbi:beta-xylosidase [Morchella snyderi]|nr:beta-xylosidase [Morchella snyderi]